MKAIRIARHGGPEVLDLVETEDPSAGPGELVVKVECAGVNFIDVYHRSGLYPLDLPASVGVEGVGVVEDVGPPAPEADPAAPRFALGDRVAWILARGAYAERVRIPASRALVLRDGDPSARTAAVLLQGLTAHYLVHDCGPVGHTLGAGSRALVHAAAGGVGLLLVQWLARLGVRVFGTVSSADKAELAREAGAEEVRVAREAESAEAVLAWTKGRGVHIAYDSVGQSTLRASLAALRPRGMLVSYGQSSGTPPSITTRELGARSLFMVRPGLQDFVATRAEYDGRANDVLALVRSGALRVRIDSELPLAEAPRAHRRLESRSSAGKILLHP